MKGLLTKDLIFMRTQWRFIFIYLLLILLFLITNTAPSFILGYCTLFFTILVMSTTGYDEANNGNSFLFTLPFSRGLYVAEKYLFGFCMGLLGWGIAVAFVLAQTAFFDPSADLLDMGADSLPWLLMVPIFLSLILPINLRFGSEKGRYAARILFALSILSVYLFRQASEAFQLPVADIANAFLRHRELTAAGATALTFVLFFFSYCVSRHIIAKKQF